MRGRVTVHCCQLGCKRRAGCCRGSRNSMRVIRRTAASAAHRKREGLSNAKYGHPVRSWRLTDQYKCTSKNAPGQCSLMAAKGGASGFVVKTVRGASVLEVLAPPVVHRDVWVPREAVVTISRGSIARKRRAWLLQIKKKHSVAQVPVTSKDKRSWQSPLHRNAKQR